MIKPADPLLSFPTVCKRDQVRDRREIRRSLAEPIAAAAIGTLTPGCELYGLTKGQFSLVDVVVALLAQTGPANVVLSTWTAAGSDIDFAMKLLADGRIKSMRFIVDYSFQSRQPAYCAALRERFGDDSIRVTKNHCKFVLILNDVWNLAIRTSMNLNENRRLENCEISDDPALAGYLKDFTDTLFGATAAGVGFSQKPSENAKDFERIGEDITDIEALARVAKAGPGYFGEGALDRDLRRIGFSTDGGRL